MPVYLSSTNAYTRCYVHIFSYTQLSYLLDLRFSLCSSRRLRHPSHYFFQTKNLFLSFFPFLVLLFVCFCSSFSHVFYQDHPIFFHFEFDFLSLSLFFLLSLVSPAYCRSPSSIITQLKRRRLKDQRLSLASLFGILQYKLDSWIWGF